MNEWMNEWMSVSLHKGLTLLVSLSTWTALTAPSTVSWQSRLAKTKRFNLLQINRSWWNFWTVRIWFGYFISESEQNFGVGMAYMWLIDRVHVWWEWGQLTSDQTHLSHWPTASLPVRKTTHCVTLCHWVTWKNRSDLVLRPNFGLRPNLHKFFKWQTANKRSVLDQNFGLISGLRPKLRPKFGLRPKLIWTRCWQLTCKFPTWWSPYFLCRYNCSSF